MQTVAKTQQQNRFRSYEVAEIVAEQLVLDGARLGTRAIAEKLYDSAEPAIKAAIREWAIAGLSAMMRAQQRREARARQQLLPGFEALGTRVPVGHQRILLSDATYQQLFDYLRLLRKRQRASPKVAKLESLIEVLKKHMGNRRRMTVQEALELESSE
jgi:hypothetical protein